MAKITSGKWKTVKLKEDIKYPFTWRTEKYGVAEFIVCPVYKYGKLREFHMYAAQQSNNDTHYIYKFDYPPMDWQVTSWTHKGIEEPRIWLFYWCKEHKCNSFRLYVPENTDCFTILTLSTFSVFFERSGL